MTKQLPVMYFSQRDNAGEAHRTCNTASCWMGAMYVRPALWNESGECRNADFNFYLPKVNRYGDTTDHNAQTRALEDVGVKSVWRTNLNRAEVLSEIDAGRPVVFGILHRGHVSAPTGGGHMILIVGYTNSGYFVHDPYGDLDLINGGYPGSTQGAFLHYSFKNLTPRWEVEGPGTGWGRVFTTNRLEQA